MANQPPFRMPCGGIAKLPKRFLGKRFNNSKRSDSSIARYINSTDPAPYEKFVSLAETGCRTEGSPLGTWDKPYPEQTFGQSGETDFSICRETGWKAVDALRFWHGQKPFDDIISTWVIEGCGATCKSYQGYKSNPSQTRYLKKNIHATVTQTDYLDNSFTEESNFDLTIDANTGIRTAVKNTLSPNDEESAALELSAALENWSGGDIIDRILYIPTSVDHVDYGDGIITGYDASDEVVLLIHFNLAAGTYDRTETLRTGSQTLTWLEESITWSATELNYQSTQYGYATIGSPGSGLGEVITRVNDMTITLSEPNTVASLRADIVSLASEWPLNDDALHSWRTDDVLGIVPLVQRSEWQADRDFEGFAWGIQDYANPVTEYDAGMLFAESGEVDAQTISSVTISESPPDPSFAPRFGIVVNTDSESGATLRKVEALEFVDGNTYTNSPTGLGTATSFEIVSYPSSQGGAFPSGITFNTSTGTVSGTASVPPDWGGVGVYYALVRANVPVVYDGSIIGIPKPEGYENSFDFEFKDYRMCIFEDCDNNPGTRTFDAYHYGQGMDAAAMNYLAGSSLPLNATHWTNLYQAIAEYPCAFIAYHVPTFIISTVDWIDCDGFPTTAIIDAGTAGYSGLRLRKMAWILDLWPSQNLARPAGDDKFLVDETKVYYAENISGSGVGSTWTITDRSGGTPTISDTSGYWGSAVFGGFFEIASYAAGVLTLGAQKFDLPTGWEISQGRTSDYDTGAEFGKLRWPSAPAILGRIGVTPDMAGTTFTFESAQINFGLETGVNTESVDLFAADMTLLSTQTATRVDDTHFTVPVAVADAKYAMIHGAEKWYMSDSSPKGDFVTRTWTNDFRTNGERERLDGVLDCDDAQVSRPDENSGYSDTDATQHCLPFVPCSPKVFCFSPNGEQFSNGITMDFPSVDLDADYGTLWLGNVYPTMADPLWQEPHKPIGVDDWFEDDGTCQEDTIEGGRQIAYYPHRPLVEAILDKTYPKFGLNNPQDETIADAQGAYDALGDFVNPPVYIGFDSAVMPLNVTLDFKFHERFCAASGACRFYDFYQPMQKGCS